MTRALVLPRALRGLAALGCALLLHGCATPAIEGARADTPVSATRMTPRAAFALTGRFSAKSERDNASGQFRYAQDGRQRSLSVFSPLGTPLGDIVALPGRVTLTLANGNVQTAPTLAELLRTLIDVPLDDAALGAWLQGLPQPGLATADVELDSGTRLPGRFVQGGWLIAVSDRETEGERAGLPRRMRWSLVAQPDVEVRWVIDEWTLK